MMNERKGDLASIQPLGTDLARSVCLSQVRLMMSSRKAACLICSESQIMLSRAVQTI